MPSTNHKISGHKISFKKFISKQNHAFNKSPCMLLSSRFWMLNNAGSITYSYKTCFQHSVHFKSSNISSRNSPTK